MYQINNDFTTGKVTVTDSWSITGTGSSAPPQLQNPNDEYVVSITGLINVEKFKTFSYDYTGQTETRYLVTTYRVSPDGLKFTDWLPLNSSIDNFPPFTATYPMFLDIKFQRKGSSTIGVIKLLEYSLIGSLLRKEEDGESTIVSESPGDTVVVKPPYIWKVFRITDLEIISNSPSSDYTIKYRFSQDYGRTVTGWEPLTKENITTIRISPIRFFQIEYLLTMNTSSVKVYDINLIGDFQNVTLDYAKSNLYGIRENCNSIKLGLVGDPDTCPNTEVGGQPSSLPVTPDYTNTLPVLCDEDKDKLFKPYQLPAATDLLNKISNDATAIFGHDVVYFLTDPDKKGTDYTFHEYQLMNYVANEMIKVAVEGNQFPENNGAINQFDLSLFDSFEVHITKEIFKAAFGPEKRPSKEDFLWFCEINKMFTIEHSQPFRGFNNNAIYYKVMLKKYVQKANIIAANATIAEKVKELTKNSTIDELFGLENIQDKKAVANKEQLKPLTHDTLRLDIKAKIQKELVDNGSLVISKSNYDLSSVEFSATYSTQAVGYRNMKTYFDKGDNIGFSCWFNINNLTMNDNYHFFNYYDVTNNLGFSFKLSGDTIYTQLNSDTYEMYLPSGLEEETWYSFVVNVDQRQRKLQKFIYKRNVESEDEAKYLNSSILKLLYKSEQDMSPVEFRLEDTTAKILSGDMKLTNIRLYLDVIPEETHNKILNQSITRDDDRYLIFADNANTRLTLPNYPIGQIKTGGV